MLKTYIESIKNDLIELNKIDYIKDEECIESILEKDIIKDDDIFYISGCLIRCEQNLPENDVDNRHKINSYKLDLLDLVVCLYDK